MRDDLNGFRVINEISSTTVVYEFLGNWWRWCVPCGRVFLTYDKGRGELPDPCLGYLPGVQFACCGHGKGTGYISFTNGTAVRFPTCVTTQHHKPIEAEAIRKEKWKLSWERGWDPNITNPQSIKDNDELETNHPQVPD